MIQFFKSENFTALFSTVTSSSNLHCVNYENYLVRAWSQGKAFILSIKMGKIVLIHLIVADYPI